MAWYDGIASPSGNGLMPWLEAIRIALSKCPAFQAWVGAAYEGDALNHIIMFQEKDENLPDRYCGLYQQTFQRNREGMGRGQLRTVPEVTLHFEENIDRAKETQTALVDIVEAVDGIMGEMEQLTWFGGYEYDTIDPSRASIAKSAPRDYVTLRVNVGLIA